MKHEKTRGRAKGRSSFLAVFHSQQRERQGSEEKKGVSKLPCGMQSTESLTNDVSGTVTLDHILVQAISCQYMIE